MREHPGALAFVEHAKALLEGGEFEQAIEVCRQGVEEHPKSIVGRVLWGKALVCLGKPADAMHEFEVAIATDRENPRVYGLVAEVFIENKLFRSALPMLRKACSLEPENPNFKLYLDYTQKALGGESPPEFISLLSWTEFEEVLQPEAVDLSDGPTQSVQPELDEDDGPTQAFDVVTDEDEEEEEEELERHVSRLAPVQRWQDNGRGGLVAHISTPKRAGGGQGVAPASQKKAQDPSKSLTLSLLDSLPDLPTEPKAPAISTDIQVRLAEREGQTYESKLKAELDAKEKRKTFWKKWGTGARGILVIGGAVVIVAGFVGWFSFDSTEKRQADITDHLIKARRSINVDVQEDYEFALESLESVLKLDNDKAEAWALKALVHARRFQGFGAAVEESKAAIQALEQRVGQKSVRQLYPDAALLVDAIVGAEAEREKAVRNILAASENESTDIQSEAGWLLFARNKPEDALARFNQALQLFPANVRALIGLSETYLALGEDDSALQALNHPALVENAAKHPLRILGLARARLRLNQEMEVSLRQIESLTPETGLPEGWRMQRERVYGLLLSAIGDEAKASVILERGKQLFSEHAFEFGLDLGDVYLRAGQGLAAQKQFEEALRQRPHSLEAKEKLSRVLVARERADEILEKISPDSNELVFARAWAWMRKGDWKKLRDELVKTQAKKQYPPRAVALLAMADAAENNIPKARSNLEMALKGLGLQRSKGKAPLQVALANILKNTEPDKAKALLQEAVGEPGMEEAACVLARLLEEEGNFAQAHSELQKALRRNGSLMCARGLSVGVLGALGQFDNAYGEALQWAEDDAQLVEALQALSLAAVRVGKADEALKAADKALLLDKNSVRSLRLKAEALFVSGRPGEAMNFLVQANGRDSLDAETFCSVGMGFFRQNNVDVAQAAFQSALRNAPKSICGNAGLWLMQSSSSKLSKEFETKVSTIKPAWEKSIALAALANAQLSAGSVALAGQTAEKALLAAPSSAIAQWIVGKVAAQNKREAEAVLAFQRATQFEPAWAEAHLLLADVLAKSPNTVEQALVSYQNFFKYNKNEGAKKLVQKKLQMLRQ
ncbi:MAG: tetratricopeptide repeat protein [Proteobacteria bacterium]|nr:tetratricopeptide repeat protein [Cystobacterineae bacterium]MCL2314843.1 tetratricopeptide repeat protein [Pseudomonadota bacterium]